MVACGCLCVIVVSRGNIVYFVVWGLTLKNKLPESLSRLVLRDVVFYMKKQFSRGLAPPYLRRYTWCAVVCRTINIMFVNAKVQLKLFVHTCLL